MSVEKVDLQVVQPETKQTFQEKKSVQSDIRESNDEEKRNAAKWMKGAAALAVVAAVGIIGHKAGAFKKLGKMFSGEASQLKNTQEAADEAAEVATNTVNPKKIKLSKAEEKLPRGSFGMNRHLSEEAFKAGEKTFKCRPLPNVIETYNTKTGKILEQRVYREDDKSLKYLMEYEYNNPKIEEEITKLTEKHFDSNGKLTFKAEYTDEADIVRHM